MSSYTIISRISSQVTAAVSVDCFLSGELLTVN